MNSFAQLFSEDAEFVNVVGLWWKGREEIRRAHEFTHATMFENSHLTIAHVKVRFPVENIAIARAQWVLEGHVSPVGTALPARNGILLNVLSVAPTGWTIIDSQNTDIIEACKLNIQKLLHNFPKPSIWKATTTFPSSGTIISALLTLRLAPHSIFPLLLEKPFCRPTLKLRH